MSDIAISIEGLKKKYRLGTIGGGTLSADLQSWWARRRGKEDPNCKLGEASDNLGSSFYALNNINLEVKKGEAIGIIGGNGAGKSTLLKILSRVTAPTEGVVKINGRVTSMLEVGTGFHGELTGRENIYMNGAILGMSKEEITSKIDQIVEFSECGQFIDTPVKRYSSGMYVKLAFSVAAHLDSDILIMDEVLAVGDVKFQQKCLGKMGDVANNEGKTVLYVSHNMNTIRQLCTRCIVLRKGQIIYDGDVEEAIRVYMDTEVQDYQSQYLLTDTSRPSFDHGRKVHLDSFSFIEKDKAVFSENEPIRMRVSWHEDENVSDLRLYCTIRHADETIIGTVKSEIMETDDRGNEKTAELEMELTNLAPGSYYFYINVITMNEFGTATSYDRPNQKIYFCISEETNQKSFEWKNRDMGCIRFTDMRLIKENS